MSASTFPTANQAASVTITALGIGTVACVVAATSVTSTVATIAYAILSVGMGATSMASITAWLDPTSGTAGQYLSNIKKHALVTIPASFQLVAQTLLQALIQGIADGISRKVSKKISG